MGWNPVVFAIAFPVAYYLAKLGKTKEQGMAIWMVVMGLALFAIW